MEASAGVSAVSFPDNKSAEATVKITFYSSAEDNDSKLGLELSKDEARELISKLAMGVQAIEDKEAEETKEQRDAAFKWYHRMTDR